MEYLASNILPPFNEHLGFEIVEWREGRVVILADVKPEHYNHSGTPHGGFIATLLDAAGALPGLFCENRGHIRKAFTLSLTISFLGQAQTSRIKAVGELISVGRNIYFSASKVYDLEDNLIASGQGVFRYRTGSETRHGQAM